MLVDRNANYRNRQTILEPKTFYGQLQRILVVDLPAIAQTSHAASETFIFGVIRNCEHHAVTGLEALDVHYYEKEAQIDVVDISTVQCVVGRIHDRNRWTIVDRSGSLARAVWEGEAE